jgi:predicted aspartyl protease
MNRNDIKFFENQITDKEKEIKVLISIKKEMNSKYSNTLKQLKFIDSGKSHNKNASFSIKTPQFNDLSANESIKSKSQASLLAQKESSSKIIGENTYLKLAADKNTGKEGKLSNIKKNN